jgi:hypothetical protein
MKRISDKLNGMQVENILDRLVPVIAAKEDYEFFRAVIGLKLESMNSAQSAAFVSSLLK